MQSGGAARAISRVVARRAKWLAAFPNGLNEQSATSGRTYCHLPSLPFKTCAFSTSGTSNRSLPADFPAALTNARSSLEEVKGTKIKHKLIAQRLIRNCFQLAASLFDGLPDRVRQASSTSLRNSDEILAAAENRIAFELLQQAHDIFHSRDDLWTPQEALRLVETVKLQKLYDMQAHFQGQNIRRASFVSNKDALKGLNEVDRELCSQLGSFIISCRQLLSAVSWNAIGAGRDAASIQTLPLRDAVQLLSGLAKSGVRREDVPTPLMQSVCAALRDAMQAHIGSSTDGASTKPGGHPTALQDRLLHVTHLYLDLPGGPSNRSALLAWVTQTSEALHALRVPPSLFETLPGFFSDCLPFLKLAIDKRTEALQLLQNLNGRDATASAAAALLAADAQEGRDFSALEVDAFVAACETHQGAAAQQLEMLDAVAASSIARVRQGFVASADTQQLKDLSRTLGAMYSDTTPPHLRHLAHMCAQQLYQRVGAWRAQQDGGEQSASGPSEDALHPSDACDVLRSLTRVLRGSPHVYGVDTSYGNKVASLARTEKWSDAAVANALRGRVGPTGHYHSLLPAAPLSIKQLSKMQVDSASRVCAAVAHAAAIAVRDGQLSTTKALSALGVLAALGEAHGGVAASTCAGQDVDRRRRGPNTGPVWKPWSRGKSAAASSWPAAVLAEADRLESQARSGGAGAAAQSGFQSDLARMLSASSFWWQKLFPAGVSDAGGGPTKRPQGGAAVKANAVDSSLRALRAEETVGHAVVNVYTLVLLRALRLAMLDYRRIAKEYFVGAASGTLPQTVVQRLTGGVEGQGLSVRYAAERQWGPAAFGYSDDSSSPAPLPELGASGDEDLSPGERGCLFSEFSEASDSEDGWLLSDAEDEHGNSEVFSRYRLQHAPSEALRAARVDAAAAAEVRQSDECLSAAHAWVLVDAMWIMKRRKQVASTVHTAASFVQQASVSGQVELDNGVAALQDLFAHENVRAHTAALLVGANMHQFRASVLRMLELCAAIQQEQQGGASGEGGGAAGTLQTSPPPLGALKQLLGPLRALHCRHTGQASTAVLRDAIAAQAPAPVSAFRTAFGSADGSECELVGEDQPADQAQALLQMPPVSLHAGASVEAATDGLLHSLYLLPPSALCGLAVQLGAREFNLHFGTVKATPNRDNGDRSQLFPARLHRKRQLEPFRLPALEAQVAVLRDSIER